MIFENMKKIAIMILCVCFFSCAILLFSGKRESNSSTSLEFKDSASCIDSFELPLLISETVSIDKMVEFSEHVFNLDSIVGNCYLLNVSKENCDTVFSFEKYQSNKLWMAQNEYYGYIMHNHVIVLVKECELSRLFKRAAGSKSLKIRQHEFADLHEMYASRFVMRSGIPYFVPPAFRVQEIYKEGVNLVLEKERIPLSRTCIENKLFDLQLPRQNEQVQIIGTQEINRAYEKFILSDAFFLAAKGNDLKIFISKIKESQFTIRCEGRRRKLYHFFT